MRKPTIDELMESVGADDSLGYCLYCGEEAYGIEPDARQCECDACGERAVYGAEELILMGAYT